MSELQCALLDVPAPRRANPRARVARPDGRGRRVAHQTVDTYGRLDDAFKNAATIGLAPLVEATDDEYRSILDTNLKGSTVEPDIDSGQPVELGCQRDAMSPPCPATVTYPAPPQSEHTVFYRAIAAHLPMRPSPARPCAS